MEYTLLQAVSELYNHKDKTEPLIFVITFYKECESPREVWIAKKWEKVMEKWNYVISEPFVPAYGYDEKTFLAQLARVNGIKGSFNDINYIVTKHKKNK